MKGLPSHGTRARYVSKAKPCRCDACKEANSAYRRGWYAQGGAAVERYKEAVNAYGREQTARKVRLR